MSEDNQVIRKRTKRKKNREKSDGKEIVDPEEIQNLGLEKYSDCFQGASGGVVKVSGGKELVINSPVENLYYGESKTIYKVYDTKEGKKYEREQKLNLYEDIRKSLEAQLQTRYGSFQMPKLPWMENKIYSLEDYYVELALLKKDRSGYITEEHIDVDDMLKSVNGKQPYRVLVEGKPGYGKTTLSKYLAYRWATQSPDCFSNFDLVFVLEIRYLKDDLLEEIVRKLNLKDVEKEDIEAAIQLHPEKNLFILDGFDEVPSFPIQQMISSIWFQEKWSRSTLVLTSRPSNTAEIRKTLHKNIVIKGIVPEKQRPFLLKYLRNTSDSESKVEKLIRLLDKLDNEELLYCPLILLLLGLLINDQHHLPIPQSRTQIYQDVFDFMVRRSLHRNSAVDENVDLFGRRGEPSPKHCIKILLSFGKFSLNMLILKKISFLEANVIGACDGDDLILNLGILFKNQVVVNNEDVEYVEAVHKTFLEFAASFYLSSLYSRSPVEFRLKILQYRMKESDELNPLFIFLVGLLGKSSYKFFKVLKKRRCGLNDLYSLVTLLTEMENPYEHLKTCVESVDNFTLKLELSKNQGEFIFILFNIISESFLDVFAAALKIAIECGIVRYIYMHFGESDDNSHLTYGTAVTIQKLFVDRQIVCPIRLLIEDLANHSAKALELFQILQPTEVIWECSCLVCSLQIGDIEELSSAVEVFNFCYDGVQFEKAKNCTRILTKFLVDLADFSTKIRISKLNLCHVFLTNQLLDTITILVYKHQLSALKLEFGRFNFPEWIVDQQIGKCIPSWFQHLLGRFGRHIAWNTNIENGIKYISNLEFASSSFLCFLPLVIGSECTLTSLNLSFLFLTEKEMNLIYTSVGNAHNLCCLTLCEQRRFQCRVDILLLCNYGQKRWQNLSLTGVSVVLPEDSSSTDLSCIEYLHLDDVQIYFGKQNAFVNYVNEMNFSKFGLNDVRFKNVLPYQ